MRKSVYNLTSDVTVMPSEIGLAPNLHITTGGDPGGGVGVVGQDPPEIRTHLFWERGQGVHS